MKAVCENAKCAEWKRITLVTDGFVVVVATCQLPTVKSKSGSRSETPHPRFEIREIKDDVEVTRKKILELKHKLSTVSSSPTSASTVTDAERVDDPLQAEVRRVEEL